jgi:RNA recognition motif-containing protein
MNHETLRDLFRCIGEVDQVKLCKNKETKLSLGYGFVKYKKEEDAMKAVQQLNGRTIQNKRIKVSFARPSSDIIKNTNLYASGLPKSFVNDDIKKFFGQAGKIISVRILTCKETGMSRGVCFVRYDTKPEAENAVRLFNGKVMPISGTTLTVKFAIPSEPATNVRNENRFRNQFERLPIENAMANQGRRFGKSISHHNIQNITMRYTEKNFPILISVTNLPLSASEKDIWAMFGPFGAVTYVSIVPDITDPSSEGTATATVSMPIYDEAIFAIRTLNQNGAKFENNKLCVAFKVSSPTTITTHKMNDTPTRENLN